MSELQNHLTPSNEQHLEHGSGRIRRLYSIHGAEITTVSFNSLIAPRNIQCFCV